MSVGSRLRHFAGRCLSRYPRHICFAGFVLPWAVFALISPAARPSFALYEVALLTTAGAALIGNSVKLGFSTTSVWWRVLAVYSLVVNFGLAEFAYIYWSLSDHTAPAFSEPLSRIDSAYLSLTTFTTTGFGDVVARSQFARLLMTCQMALTFVAVATGVAILLGARPVTPGASTAQQPESV